MCYYFVVDITADFKAHVRELIPLLLCRQNLIVKQIHGSPITGRELIEYFKVSTAMLHVVFSRVQYST